MKNARHLLQRLVESEGSLTAAVAKMGSEKSLSYWSKVQHGKMVLSREEYRLLRSAVPGGRRRRKNISVHPETYAVLCRARRPGTTWDEWFIEVAKKEGEETCSSFG